MFQFKLINIIKEEIKNTLDEISHGDIQTIDKDWIKIGDETYGSKVIQKNQLPDKLYHVTPYKNQILSDGYLKSQRMGKGFGGGRLEGVSVTSDVENAITYYWGIVLAALLSKAKNREDLSRTLDWWILKQENRIGGDLSKLKDIFFENFDSQIEFPTSVPFMDAVISARKMMHLIAERINAKLKDPIIVGGIERLSKINFNDIVIFVLNKNDISDDIPIITGTDTDEIRILGDVPVKDFFTPNS